MKMSIGRVDLKYVIFAALVTALALPAYAKTAETAVRSAIDECRGWVEGDQTQGFSPSWVNVVENTHQSDTGDSVTRVYLSSQFPLEITTNTIGSEIAGDPVSFGSCSVEPVDPSRGQYRYRLRSVDIGDTWNNLATLPLEAVQQQLLELQGALTEDSAYVEDIDDARPSSHGTNMTFWLCSNDRTLYYNVLPDGVIEAASSNWSASIHYASTPFERSAPSRANCPAS